MNSPKDDQEIPISKSARSAVVGKAAGKIGLKKLGFLAKKPFAGKEKQKDLQNRLEEETATLLFDAMRKMRGTALKVAQAASMEVDQMPESFRRELSKSCYQVPPLNRAVVRKVFINEFGSPPEKLFESFEPTAFAAASLGQVHRAVTREGKRVAVKIQYPAIADTIQSDLELLEKLLKTMPQLSRLREGLGEVRDRLSEEVDYVLEAKSTKFFREKLDRAKYIVPQVFPEFSTGKILTTDHLDGLHLEDFLATNPSQEIRNRCAQHMWDGFVFQTYELNYIHADPNPGNYLFQDDGKLAVLDFGCMKKLEKDFLVRFQDLTRCLRDGSETEVAERLGSFNCYVPKGNEDLSSLYKTFQKVKNWFRKFFGGGSVHFGEIGAHIFDEAYSISMELIKHKHFIPNKNFLFLDRTRFGLFRIFQQLNARVTLESPAELN